MSKSELIQKIVEHHPSDMTRKDVKANFGALSHGGNDVELRPQARRAVAAALWWLGRPSPWGLAPPILCQLSWRARLWVKMSRATHFVCTADLPQ
jgi:hypothetical protein